MKFNLKISLNGLSSQTILTMKWCWKLFKTSTVHWQSNIPHEWLCKNCRIWGSHQTNAINKYVHQDSPKLNVLCCLNDDQVVGPFNFIERTITGNVHFDMLEQYIFPSSWTNWTWITCNFPTRYLITVLMPDTLLIRNFLNWWPGSTLATKNPNLTPINFSFWGYLTKCGL